MSDLSTILDQIGMDYKDVGDNYRVKCWLHEERTPSLFIHKETGVYHCFSCHTKGNMISFLRIHMDLEYADALLYLKDMALGGLSPEERFDKLQDTIRNHNQTSVEKKVEHTPGDMPVNKKIKYHEYLMDKRKLTLEEIKKYDIRVCVDPMYDGWVLIPVYFKGVLRTYFLRDPIGNRKLYGKQDRSDILYGYDQIEDYKGLVCLTEGMFDKYFCERIGNQTLAVLSNRLLEQQLEYLKSFSEVVIFHDNDDAEAGMYLIQDSLKLLLYTKVSVASLPLVVKDCADNKNYTSEQLYQMTKDAFDNRVDLVDFLGSKRYRNFLIMEHNKKNTAQRRR